MSDAALLNELCSICNINKHKYRCPGCSARTCSLPCYKRHQQWAQCSGQRDPTKFVKKSELVTPAGVDHDFNFLSGIERNLEKAEKKVASTTSAGTPPEGQSIRERAGVPYTKLAAATGVTIIQAPKGLSRQKENKSHISNQKRATKNAVWTIEWIDDTKRRVLTETTSTRQIKDAQPFVQHATETKHKKRKLNPAAPSIATPQPPADRHSQSKLEDGASTSETQVQPLQRLQVDLKLEVDDEKPKRTSPGRGASPKELPESSAKRETDMADTRTGKPSTDGPSTWSVGNRQHRYFLLRPRTSTSRHVLIPLNSSHTLAESLHRRTVLEFPTIYVFPSSMATLPEEFMLEEEYVRQEGEEQKEFNDLIRELDPEILRRLKEGNGEPQSDRGGTEEEIDDKRILDVLQQDLGGRL